jgi:Flp pilus assembly protein TadG
MSQRSRSLKDFFGDNRGSVAIFAAAAFPTLVFGAGTAVDISRWYGIKGEIQSVADATALAVVKESSLAGMTDQKLNGSAVNFARGSLGSLSQTATINSNSSLANGTLTVEITVKSPARFAGILGVASQDITVDATARLVGGSTKICLLALDPTKNKALEAAKSAKITAPECSFFVNSKDPKGLDVKDVAKLTAQIICTSGGYAGNTYNFATMPKTDCPPIPDPLANRPPPTAAHCDFNNKIVEDAGIVNLKPGVYCGGLKITKTAHAKLDPGIYVMRGSKLIVDSDATLEGSDVGFYFQDSNAQFEFDTNTTINIAAPVNGPMAGILMYEDRSVPSGSKHSIRSNNAHTLLGTIYLPRGLLFIDSNKPISQKAAYTILIANQIEMIAGPELFLNANYGATTVPVPVGVGPVPGRPTLVR